MLQLYSFTLAFLRKENLVKYSLPPSHHRMGHSGFLAHLMLHFDKQSGFAYVCLAMTGQKWPPHKRTEAWVICVKGFRQVVAFLEWGLERIETCRNFREPKKMSKTSENESCEGRKVGTYVRRCALFRMAANCFSPSLRSGVKLHRFRLVMRKMMKGCG